LAPAPVPLPLWRYILAFDEANTLDSLLWALLQERITTTSYGADKKIFRHTLVLNTVQSLFASISGYVYFRMSTSGISPEKRVFPGLSISLRLLLVALTQTLSSPFGYASLKHIDYITYILAKSCKLLPVMFLHVTLFRRRYPLYKYLVVLAVSAGVTIFTLYPSTPKKAKRTSVSDEEKNVVWGMSLLLVNLLFDGLTNTIQDDIFATAPKGLVSGPQMMAALNTLSSILTSAYLILNPWSAELSDAIAFISKHPAIGVDILGFAFCGAIGQVFICMPPPINSLTKF
jgi:UDP-galactose transporter B1